MRKSVEKARLYISIVTPAYNEEDNLQPLYERLSIELTKLDIDWEWIIIDDHSSDATFDKINNLQEKDHRVKGKRFARNSGSHSALSCGLDLAKGDCAIVLAADLQDPPEVIPELLQKWENGAQVVWAVRAKRIGESSKTVGFAKLYYWLMRKYVGMENMPSQGADFFLVDRKPLEALNQFGETNVSILALLTWIGFRQDSIEYVKQARLHGESGWSLEKKLKLVVDSLTSFTYKPIRFMGYFGFLTAVVGFLYALFVIVNGVLGNPNPGWSSLMVVVLFIGGIQMIMMSLLGEYLWRTLDESRKRPRFLIEDEVGFDDTDN